MKHYKWIITLLCVALLVSAGFHISQFVSRRNEFRQASEHFSVQFNDAIRATYGQLNGIIDGRTVNIAGTDYISYCYRSPESIQRFGMQMSVIYSLIASNEYLSDLSWRFAPNFRVLGMFISDGGGMTSAHFSGEFPGILYDGIVSDNEVMFLEALRDILGVLQHNECLDIRALRERLLGLVEQWEMLPAELLAAG